MSVSANPNYGIVAVSATAGGPLIDFNNNTFLSSEANGFSTTGILVIYPTGSVTWIGDSQGVSEGGLTWWAPVGTTDGTGWSCQVVYIGGTNGYTGTPTLGVWTDITTTPAYNWIKNPSGGAGGGSTVGTFRFDISNDGGSSTYDTVTFTVTMFEDTI